MESSFDAEHGDYDLSDEGETQEADADEGRQSSSPFVERGRAMREEPIRDHDLGVSPRDGRSSQKLEVDELVIDALSRWSHVSRHWSRGVLEEATVEGDRDHLILALDALVENAVDHTAEDDAIE